MVMKILLKNGLSGCDVKCGILAFCWIALK